MRPFYATIVATFIAPLVPFGAVTAWVVISTGSISHDLWDSSLLWFTYLLALGPTVLMLPLLLALKRGGLVNLPSALGFGAVAGTVLGWIWLRGLSKDLALCGLVGACETLVFWLIWRFFASDDLAERTGKI
jgi:hypothetical protein